MDKLSKKGSLTSRTLEKLGFSAFRLRSNSQPDDLEQARAKARGGSSGSLNKTSTTGSDPDKASTVTTIACGELEYSEELVSPFTVDSLDAIAKKSPKKTLRERFLGPKHGLEDTAPTAKFYVDNLENDMVTSKPEVASHETNTTPTAKFYVDDLENDMVTSKPEVASHETNTAPTAKFYVDDLENDMVTSKPEVASHETRGVSGGSSTTTSTMQDKKKKVAPEGTNEYIVQDRDTLERIAAKHDTTPSTLKKVNRLVTSMIFAGQTIFVPDKDYVFPISPPPKAKAPDAGVDRKTSDTTSPPGSAKDNRPQMDVPLVKAGNTSPTHIPGHVERQTPVSSPGKDAFDFEMVAPPHKLSEDEVQQLDQDCMERFIKLNVKHITDGQGVVRGVLLVTPNAVMFDPDVSDPLVLERGAEKYGMIAPMDLIISAAMYHDIAAMKLRGQKMDDGTVYPKPEVYHDKSCPLAKERLEQSQKLDQDHADSALPKHLHRILSKPLTKTDSVCSCGAGGAEVDLDTDIPGDTDPASKSPASTEDAADEFNKSRTDETIPDESSESDTKASDKDKDDVFRDGAEDSADIGDIVAKDSDDVGELAKSGASSNVQKGKKLSVSFSIPDSGGLETSDSTDAQTKTSSDETENEAQKNDTVAVSDSEKGEQNSVKDTQDVDGVTVDESCDGACVSGNVETVPAPTTPTIKTSVEADVSDEVAGAGAGSDNNSTRIGNIVYMPVVEDANGQLSLRAIEDTKNTLAKRSESEFTEISKSDTNIAAAASFQYREPEKPRSSSTSSLGPFSPTPHLNAFVNYATGFFQKHASENSIKDIKDMILDASPLQSKPASDVPVISAAPSNVGRRKGKMSRHDNAMTTSAGGQQGVEVESAVTMEEKADLMTMDYDHFSLSEADMPGDEHMMELEAAGFKPRQSQTYPDPPLYLCLKLGQPQNRPQVFHNYSIEAYGRRRKKAEYWFSIPREKVDHLYAFFVQWTPEIYGDEEDLTAERRGFVVIKDGEDEDLEMLDEHFGPNSSFQKDWEIISQSEALKRRSIVFDVPLPLPELIGESAILSEEHIRELSQSLPGRTVGYPWTLIYSTDKHGFSLKTLYRDMLGLESPILLVVKDTYDNVFGALTSCELRISESFYGTGETFLYTFFPDFQIFHWSGENNFFIKGDNHSLCIGAGQGVNGLWLDEDLYHGRTNKCETFNNDILTTSEDFVLKAFEAWAFIFD